MYRFDNIFTQEELSHMKDIVSLAQNEDSEIRKDLGRLSLDNVILPETYIYKIAKLVKNVSPMMLVNNGQPLTVIYSAEYGQPNLPPHYDGDDVDLIVDFQLDGNTTWSLGLDEHLYSMKNNTALAFNANKYIHWRPHKEFKEGEYVTMMFFRFFSPVKRSDYSHMSLSQNSPAFDSVKSFRDSLQ